MKILILIRDLGSGGAQRQVLALAPALAARGHDVVVVTCYPGGALEKDLGATPVRRACLDKRDRHEIAGFLRRLAERLRAERPDVIYSFLVLGNLLSGLLRPVVPEAAVAWGIRASDMDLTRYGLGQRASDRLERWLARRADVIVANSWAGARQAEIRGLPAEKLVVVPNGIDTERIRPDATAGLAVRAAWGVPRGVPLFGLVGRIDPMKDHETFLAAMAIVRRARPDAMFACVGGGSPGARAALLARGAALGLGGSLVVSDDRGDVAAVYNALTVLVSSSAFGEGFSNVLGEAQAAGVPCVATDVGDARRIVAEGAVVPPRDPAALARASLDVLARREREGDGLSARRRCRVESEYPVARLAERTEDALVSAVRAAAARTGARARREDGAETT